MAGLSTILKPATSGSTVTTNTSGYISGDTTATAKKGTAAYDARVAEFEQQRSAAARNNYEGFSDGSGVSFSNVRQASMSNGNPMARSGLATLNINGRGFSVPNAFAQQMLYQQAWNAGRWGLGELVAPRATEEERRSKPYEDWTAMEKQLEAATQKYNVNARTRADVEADIVAEQAKLLEASKPVIAREEVAVNGQVIKSNALERERALQGIMQRMNDLGRELQSFQQRRISGGIGQNFAELQGILKQAPTRSNLPIKESVIFSK